MKKITIGSKSPTNVHLISKIFRIYIYPIVKYSTVFDSGTIIELHMFWLKIPIVQANLGKKQSKLRIIKIVLIYLKYITY